MITLNDVKTLRDTLQKFSELPEKMPLSSEICEISRALDSLAVQAAYLSERISWRGGDGCGDHGEKKAREKAEKRTAKVRKALGY